MEKDSVYNLIKDVGLIPAIRVGSTEEAVLAAESICQAGIPIVELTMTVPGITKVIRELRNHCPDVVIGCGTILNLEQARQSLEAGAAFITSPGLDIAVVEFAVKAGVVAIPGALTPTEVMSAWNVGADFVKIFPCSPVGGPRYIRALRAPFPRIPLIASGGVTQQTAAEYIHAGAVALGIGGELIPREAIHLRQPDRIAELAGRFAAMIQQARNPE